MKKTTVIMSLLIFISLSACNSNKVTPQPKADIPEATEPFLTKLTGFLKTQLSEIKSEIRIKTPPRKIYSIDKYDGHLSLWDGHYSIFFDSNYQSEDGSSLASYYNSRLIILPFVTFKISEIDLERVKSIKLHIYQYNPERLVGLAIDFWLVEDNDYEKWQDCEFYQYNHYTRNLTRKRIFKSNKPKGCGFTENREWATSQGDWQYLVRYEQLEEFVSMNRAHSSAQWWSSTEISGILKENFTDKQYVTIQFFVNYPLVFEDDIQPVYFRDGNSKNGELRPYLEVKYQ